jgi:hypothetical protein
MPAAAPLVPIIAEAAVTLGPVVAETVATAAPLIAEVASTVAPVVAEAATAVAPVVAEAASSLAPMVAEVGGAVAPEVAGLAQQIGTTGPMIADLMPQAVPVAEAAGQVAPGATEVLGSSEAWQPMNLAQELRGVAEPVASQVAPPSAVGPWQPATVESFLNPAHASAPLQTPAGSPGITSSWQTPQGAMANITGPQMSTMPAEASLASQWGAPAANMSTMSGPAYGGAMPAYGGAYSGSSTPATKSASLMDNKWLKAGMKGLSQGMENMGGGGQDQQQTPSAQASFGGPAPDLNPYQSGHVSAQQAFAQSIMKDYLSGGGYG